MDPGANFRLAEGRKRTSSAGRGLRDDLRLHLSGQPKRPSSCGVISRVVTNAAGRADRDLRKIPSRIASPSTNGPRLSTARTEGGHWEGDLIICKRTRPVLVLHERKSRVTLAARLAGKTAAETISVMLAVFARIEPALRKSITFDNDTAFAQHVRPWASISISPQVHPGFRLRRHCLLDGSDPPPLMRRYTVDGHRIGKPIERDHAVFGVTCAPSTYDLNEAKSHRLPDCWRDAMAMYAVVLEIIIGHGEGLAVRPLWLRRAAPARWRYGQGRGGPIRSMLSMPGYPAFQRAGR